MSLNFISTIRKRTHHGKTALNFAATKFQQRTRFAATFYIHILTKYHWSILVWKHSYFPFTHWSQDKMAAIFQKTFSNAFSWMKIYEFQLEFHWSLFLRVQLTIFQPRGGGGGGGVLTIFWVTGRLGPFDPPFSTYVEFWRFLTSTFGVGCRILTPLVSSIVEFWPLFFSM